ncbi:MAG TPA: hypothetical protein VGM64_02210 [Lacunisphaera sp.]|jgi:hypothetical protein
MQTNRISVSVFVLTAASAVFSLTSPCGAADAAATSPAEWTKPAWLGELSLSAKESYDDNLLGVSGKALNPESAWVSSLSFKLGLNLMPLPDQDNAIKTFTLVYAPEKFWYDGNSAENYTSHRINSVIAGKSGNISFSLDNAFLYVDGNKEAPTYALNQFAGAAANQNDKFRNNYAHAPARERRAQVQDRYTASLQYTSGNFFVRAASAMTLFDLDTDLHNTSVAPYKGYQNYVDRYDINGGLDFGYKITPAIALTLGYRDGYQYQQKFDVAISADQHASSNHYQRVLFGLEGKPAKWLTAKLAVGPDARKYESSAAIADLSTTRFYGEGSLTATLPQNQSLSLTYKQWLFVGSTGLAPYDDITYALTYHWSATRQLGFDLGFKYLEANYTIGNEVTGSAPALRDDLDYVYSAGATYAFTPHLLLSASFVYDQGKNGLDDLAASFGPSYREFEHGLSTFGIQYKF